LKELDLLIMADSFFSAREALDGLVLFLPFVVVVGICEVILL
jgi:hypothetical protein